MTNKTKEQEHILLLSTGSSDEIIMMVVDIELLEDIQAIINNPRTIPIEEIDEIIFKIYRNHEKYEEVNKGGRIFQTYVKTNFNFNNFNIVKVLNLPQLGY